MKEKERRGGNLPNISLIDPFLVEDFGAGFAKTTFSVSFFLLSPFSFGCGGLAFEKLRVFFSFGASFRPPFPAGVVDDDPFAAPLFTASLFLAGAADDPFVASLFTAPLFAVPLSAAPLFAAPFVSGFFAWVAVFVAPAAAVGTKIGGPLLVGPFDSIKEYWLFTNFSSQTGWEANTTRESIGAF